MQFYHRHDPYLNNFRESIETRHILTVTKEEKLTEGLGSLHDFANGHQYFGVHKTNSGWICREWAPNATAIQLVGQQMGWNNTNPAYAYKALENGVWELQLDHHELQHEDLFKLRVQWPGGSGLRLPVWVNRVVQDEQTKEFSAQIWAPNKPYVWKNQAPTRVSRDQVLIYEAHVGMSAEEGRVNSFSAFTKVILPRIARMGYTVIQLMAIQEHPYYGSFGYHVSNFFAASSRFGTPDELKELIDTAHGLGIQVIMDIVHSHAVKNTQEGPGLFDGTPGMFFHTNERRDHPAWDSLCFDYSKNETLHFLLSNCKYWLTEYRFDGFRFDGVTSMLYLDHGLERSFDSYDLYFNDQVDEDACIYLSLANKLIKEVNPKALSVAEEMSGMPGLGASFDEGGMGFTHRLAMGIPDFWIKMIKEKSDEEWNVSQLYYELTNSRPEEKTISYAESHDQALVGDKTIIFRLADREMYSHMAIGQDSLIIDRALALHKMIRLLTASTNNGGYLNFMGNEFGHPEWIDFPREGNNWSYHYARRQWSLADSDALKYQFLNRFDEAMIELLRQVGKQKDTVRKPIHQHETDQVLVFQKGEYLFIFNFNPSQSFSDYGFACEAADFQIVLHTDQPEYGGFGRIDANILLESVPERDAAGTHRLMCYLPSRTALVVKRLPTPSIHRLKR